MKYIYEVSLTCVGTPVHSKEHGGGVIGIWQRPSEIPAGISGLTGGVRTQDPGAYEVSLLRSF